MKQIFIFVFIAAQCNTFVAAQNHKFPKLAIKGYDVVAYFSVNKAIPGDKEFQHVWHEQTWRFANQAHLDSFRLAPEKYAPQYGAYCAWAVAHNYTAPVDPEAWEIVNGKLYLNYNKDVQKKWREKREEYIKSGDQNWPELRAKEK